jgi:phospholipid/cholesterol/gamma-HCH transport system substrate-binding protein
MNTMKETAVGFFVLLGILCVSYLAIKLGRMELIEDQGYHLTAKFTSVSGLRVGANVEMAGVPVGKVASIRLENSTTGAQAVLMLRFDTDLKLADDTIASIKTSGLIGDKYVSISPGGSENLLAAGGTIEETEPSLDIESLIGKYAFGGV